MDVSKVDDIRPHTLDILEVLKPKPSLVIIGTGKEREHIVDSIYNRFPQHGITIKILPTFEAVSTFNVSQEDGIEAAAFLIPSYE